MRRIDWLNDPAQFGAVITPADSDFAGGVEYRYLWVGGAGAVRVTTVGGSDILLSGVPAGTELRVSVKRVWATNTTATLIVGLR